MDKELCRRAIIKARDRAQMVSNCRLLSLHVDDYFDVYGPSGEVVDTLIVVIALLRNKESPQIKFGLCMTFDKRVEIQSAGINGFFFDRDMSSRTKIIDKLFFTTQ